MRARRTATSACSKGPCNGDEMKWSEDRDGGERESESDGDGADAIGDVIFSVVGDARARHDRRGAIAYEVASGREEESVGW